MKKLHFLFTMLIFSVVAGASADVTTEFFIALYNGSRESPSPETFVGEYTAFGLGGEFHEGIGGGGFISYTISKDWNVYSIGGGFGIGGNVKVTGELRLGKTVIVTPVKPTNDRQIIDLIYNNFIHFIIP